MIAKSRSKKEAGFSYGELGDKSPLLENSQVQSDALEMTLNASGQHQFKSFVCMRYWHPMADQVARDVKDFDPDRIILLPLYPQYSTTTTRSSHQQWVKAASKAGLDASSTLICCYPDQKGFIDASAYNLRGVYDQAFAETAQQPRILFSAHGLPESIVKDGDPYQRQCEDSAASIVRAAGLSEADWQICYQSRVGPKKWLGPSTEEALEKAAADNISVIILPHAFTQEHVETLVEIDIEYREVAHKLGVPGFYKVPTVGTHPAFINGLAEMVQSRIDGGPRVAPHINTRICPAEFCRCAMQDL
jgi:ferrochelatase